MKWRLFPVGKAFAEDYQQIESGWLYYKLKNEVFMSLWSSLLLALALSCVGLSTQASVLDLGGSNLEESAPLDAEGPYEFEPTPEEIAAELGLSMDPEPQDLFEEVGNTALTIEIDKSSQTMYVSGMGVNYRWRVSTARRGYSTPTGSYSPKRLEKMWYSRKYDMSPMPHSIFFHGGYAIHATDAIGKLGRPASHGCVRLHPRNAATLFSLVRKAGMKRTRIYISN